MRFYCEAWINGERQTSDLMPLGHCLSWMRLTACDVVGHDKAKQITSNIRKQFNRESNTARCGWNDSSIMVFLTVIKDGSL